MRIETFGALTFVMTATTAAAQQVNVDVDRSAAFATYRSYAWVTGTASRQPGDARICEAVDARLAAKGLSQVATAADVFVVTRVVTEERKAPVGGGFDSWPIGGATANLSRYVQRTVVVELYDASTRRIVWRGIGIDTVNDRGQHTADIDKTLEKMFRKYPRSAALKR
jgi:hypothetical protein